MVTIRQENLELTQNVQLATVSFWGPRRQPFHRWERSRVRPHLRRSYITFSKILPSKARHRFTCRGRQIFTPPSCSIICDVMLGSRTYPAGKPATAHLTPVSQPSYYPGNGKQHREKIKWEACSNVSTPPLHARVRKHMTYPLRGK